MELLFVFCLLSIDVKLVVKAFHHTTGFSKSFPAKSTIYFTVLPIRLFRQLQTNSPSFG